MVILHANWIRGRLFLWGESAISSSTIRADASKKSKSPPINPFSLSPLYLAATIRAYTNSCRRISLRSRHARLVSAHLPAFQNRPIPSLPYLAPQSWPAPPLSPPPSTSLFLVSALPLSTRESSAFLAHISNLPTPNQLSKTIRIAPDLLAFSRLWAFANSILSRQRILPSIRLNLSAPLQFRAASQWIPILDRPDLSHLNSLCSFFPACASAFESASSPSDAFYDFIDLLMRSKASTTLSRLHAQRNIFHDLHSAFLASLRTESPFIRLESLPSASSPNELASELSSFANSLAQWRSPAEVLSDSSLSLGFRITDPASPSARTPRWSLFPVVVSQTETTPLTPKLLASLPPAKARLLLTALGQASIVAPELPTDATAGVSSNGASFLSAPEVYAFLKEGAISLRAAGFPVFAPAWWSQNNRSSSDRLRIRATSVSIRPGLGRFSLDSLLDIKWEIVLGNDTLSASDLAWMLSSNEPLLHFRDRWVALNAKSLKIAQQKLARLLNSSVSLRDLVNLGFSASDQADVPIDVEPSLFPEQIRSSRLLPILNGRGKLERVPVPKGFRGILRQYQRRGLDWLSFLHSWGFGACLADDMGLGKTIEAIAAFLSARTNGNSSPVLVICPMSIMLKWQREINRFSPRLKTWIYHGPNRPRNDEFFAKVSSCDVCITSYQLLCSEFESFKNVHWGIVTLDEAQNIKNPRTAKSRAARSLNASWRIALTGTPVENSVADIWAIMDFLNPGLLLDQASFTERFHHPIATGSDPAAKDELRRLTAPFILRRLKTDPKIISDMPQKVEEKVYCNLTQEQAQLYASEVRDLDQLLGAKTGIARHGAILALLTRLKQICNHPSQYEFVVGDELPSSQKDPLDVDRSCKLARLDEMLEEVLAANECALVFTQYAVMGRLLAAHLSSKFGFEVPFLHGEIPMKKRDEMVARFQRPDGPPIFLLSIKAGGTGLDLTRANHVFHYDRWWNPAVENQATDRAHRIGQTKTVFVHTFICEGTLESHIDDLITGKLELAEKLISGGDHWLASLDREKLNKVISLSADFQAEDDE